MFLFLSPLKRALFGDDPRTPASPGRIVAGHGAAPLIETASSVRESSAEHVNANRLNSSV